MASLNFAAFLTAWLFLCFMAFSHSVLQADSICLMSGVSVGDGLMSIRVLGGIKLFALGHAGGNEKLHQMGEGLFVGNPGVFAMLADGVENLMDKDAGCGGR